MVGSQYIWHFHVCIRTLHARSVCTRHQGLCDEWKASEEWGLTQLANGKYKDEPLKAGEDDDGYSVRLRVKYFMQYCMENKDDSPLYMFDDSFDERKVRAFVPLGAHGMYLYIPIGA